MTIVIRLGILRDRYRVVFVLFGAFEGTMYRRNLLQPSNDEETTADILLHQKLFLSEDAFVIAAAN